MNDLSEKIKALIDKEDVDALVALVPEVSKTEDAEKIKMLGEAIEEVLGIWEYDFYCKKMGDPGKWPYLQGIAAIEKLSGQFFPLQRANYYGFQMQYQIDQGDLSRARPLAQESEALYRQSIQEGLQTELAYRKLIYLLVDFPISTQAEKLIYWQKAYDLVNEGISRFSSSIFYSIKLDLLHERAVLPSDLIEEKTELFKQILEKSKADCGFAFDLCEWYERRLRSVQDLNEKSQAEDEFLQLLAAAQKVNPEREIFLTQAGHLFARAGKHFRDEKWLLVAEKFFQRSLQQSEAYPLLYTYVADCRKVRAEIYADGGDATASQKLREQIRDDYLNQWSSFAEDISYLSHALDFLYDFGAEMQDESEQKAWCRKIKPIALAAEKRGKGVYWFPYQHLILISVAVDEFDEAKLWLGRGFLVLSLLVEKQIYQLAELFKKNQLEPLTRFIAPLVKRLEDTPKDRVWRGGVPWKDVSEMDLSQVEKRLRNEAII